MTAIDAVPQRLSKLSPESGAVRNTELQASLRILSALILTVFLWVPKMAMAGGTPANGSSSDALLAANGNRMGTDIGDFVSAISGASGGTLAGGSTGNGLQLPYRFFIEVPPDTERMVVELFDPDILAGISGDELAGGRDVLRATADTVARYRLYDPSGQPVAVRFGAGDNLFPGDNQWVVLFDTATASATGTVTFADSFDSVSYGNQDGTESFATDWIETLEHSLMGPGGGNLQITGGQLSISNTNDPDSIFRSKPSVERELNLSGYEFAVLSFDWDTGTGMEDNDSIIVEASDDGGVNWVGLAIYDDFLSGASSGSQELDLTDLISANTRIRFRVFDFMAGPGEAFLVDNLVIRAGNGASGMGPNGGHWQLEVDMNSRDRNGMDDDHNAFGLRAHTGDPGPGGSELNVYAHSYLGVNAVGEGQVRTMSLFPYVTEGCEFDVNDFDFDADAEDPDGVGGVDAPYGSWDLMSRLGFVDDEGSVMSDNNSWNSATVTGFQDDRLATDYGIYSMELEIQDFGTVSNMGVVYIGAEDAVAPAPTGSPEADSLRIYFPRDDGQAPAKPYLTQKVLHVSGSNPPLQGEVSRFALIVEIVNPAASIGPIAFNRSEGRLIVVSTPTSSGDVEMTFQGVAPGFPTSGTVLSGGDSSFSTVSWDSGEIQPGNSETLILFIDVEPLVATDPLAIPVTGTYLNSGTVGTFLDEAATPFTLGNLCGLAVFAGPSAPLTEGLNAALDLQVAPGSLSEPGGDLEYTVNIQNLTPGGALQVDALAEEMLGDLTLLGENTTCTMPQVIDPEGTYSCTFTVSVIGNAGISSTRRVTASIPGLIVPLTDSLTIQIEDSPASWTVVVTPDPTTVPPGSTEVNFMIEVTNTSVETDAIQLTSLGSSLHGDLDLSGDCSLPQSIATDASYSCTYSGSVSGTPEDVVFNQVTAGGQDDEGQADSFSGQAQIQVTIDDQASPSVTLDLPASQALWPLSPSQGPANTRAISWTMTDDTWICRVDVKLQYSNDLGGSWIDVAPGGGLPAQFGPGGVCNSPGESRSTVDYTIPTTSPSGNIGSLYRAVVRVTDAAEKQQLETGPSFFIDHQTFSSAKTLVLWHEDRMRGHYPDSEVDSMKVALEELIDHPRVAGILLDLGGLTSLTDLYASWDQASEACSSLGCLEEVNDLANEVLFESGGVQEHLHHLRNLYSQIRYVIVIGDDRMVPFARLRDRTSIYLEENYIDLDGEMTAESTVGQALQENRYLSDDPLVSLQTIDPVDLKGRVLYLPELATGRLVETPSEIETAIETFMSQDGSLDLSTFDTVTNHKVLVTGYDFLLDSAGVSRDLWNLALQDGSPMDPSAPVDASLISPGWGLPTVSEREGALLERLSGNGGHHYGIINLNGHATHYEEGVPGGSVFINHGLDAISIYGEPGCESEGTCPVDLMGSVVYSMGCHGGLTVPGSDAEDLDHSLDIPQTFLARGVQAYIANTGYGWGYNPGIGLSESLIELMSRELTLNTDPLSTAIGDRLNAVKLRYFQEAPSLDVYAQKSLMQWTLFGFPMYSVSGIQTDSEPLSPTIPSMEIDWTVGQSEGGGGSPLPDFLISGSIIWNFSAVGVYTKYTNSGEIIEAGQEGCPSPDGCYYTFGDLTTVGAGPSDLPIQPYTLVTGFAQGGFGFHGVLWKGGTYRQESSWAPTTARLISNGGDNSEIAVAPRHVLVGPIGRRWTPGEDPSDCSHTDQEIPTIVLTLGEAVKEDQNDLEYNIQRIYETVDLEILQYNNTDDPTANCDRLGPEFLPPLEGDTYHQVDGSQVKWKIPLRDLVDGTPEIDEVWRALVVVNDDSLNPFSRGSWDELELSDEDGDGVWEGQSAFPGAERITYLLQAVDRKGNVSWLEFIEDTLPSSGIPTDLPEPTDVDLPPSIGVTVQGTPLAIPEIQGVVTWNIEVQNQGGIAVTLDQMQDGDGASLDGRGSCVLPQNLELGDSYTCAYDEGVAADPGLGVLQVTETVTAEATAPASMEQASAQSSGIVDVLDLLPGLSLQISADPQTLVEPGGVVQFEVVLQSVGSPETLDLAALSVNGMGSCSLPQILVPGSSYTCHFSETLSGNTGDMIVRSVTASVEDNEGNTSQEIQTVTVLIVDAPPQVALQATVDSQEVVEPGGNLDVQLHLQNLGSGDTLRVVSLEDDFGSLSGRGDCMTGQDVDPLATYSCSYEITLNGAAGEDVTLAIQATMADDDGHQINIGTTLDFMFTGVDWGDAPDPTYPTTSAMGGANHTIRAGFFLGSVVDAEPNGQPSPDAQGDDSNRIADEDGIVWITPLIPGTLAEIDVQVSTGSLLSGVLDMWIDWQGDGSWDSTEDWVLREIELSAGIHRLTFPVPLDAPLGLQTFARSRLSMNGVDGPTGSAQGGEVEDDVVSTADPSMVLAVSVAPETLQEPGGNLQYSLDLTNSGDVPITVTQLSDTRGTLAGSSCRSGSVLLPGATYSCDSTETAQEADAGETLTNTFQALASAGAVVLEAGAVVQVPVLDVGPAMTVGYSANPLTVDEPGGEVTFEVLVSNQSSAESFYLDLLVDDQFGDLTDLANSTCVVPQEIGGLGAYACSATVGVTGNAGDLRIHTLSASGTDNEGGRATEEAASQAITILDVLPSVSLMLTPESFQLPETGGAIESVTVMVQVTDLVGAEATTLSEWQGLPDDTTCEEDVALPYSCELTLEVSGEPGTVEWTFLVVVVDDDGNTEEESTTLSIELVDVAPQASLVVTADPSTVTAPGGDVTLEIEIQNLSEVDALVVESLRESLLGELDVTSSTCEPPDQGILPLDSYLCEAVIPVEGVAGTSQQRLVGADLVDNEDNELTVEGVVGVTVQGFDYGDAPDTFPTTGDLAASHLVLPGFTLGSILDDESDGQPTPDALGDDNDGIDDEDGVIFGALSSGQLADVEIFAIFDNDTSVFIDAWADWNGDGAWQEPEERLLTAEPLVPGSNLLQFPVPMLPSGFETFARFRMSTIGNLMPWGSAPNGEVEDYRIQTEDLGTDWGDVPEPYPGPASDDGARHRIQPGIFIGDSVDGEPDHQEDDGLDEDGVLFPPTALQAGETTTISIDASTVGFVDAWIDFGADGSWSQAEDAIFTKVPLSQGANLLQFEVPVDANQDTLTYGRFRFSTTGGLSYQGLAGDGEVEDYALMIADTTSPKVEAVLTYPSAVSLGMCTSLDSAISGFDMTFSERVADPPGNDDADDVTNPLNYGLLRPGDDRSFQTDICGLPAGDDQTIELIPTIYSEETQSIELRLDTTRDQGLFRLFACGSTSIVDLNGNSLDGNGDGEGGDDFRLQFRVDEGNVWSNGHFDCDVSGWDLVSGNSAEITFDSDDHEGSLDSGSLRMENLSMSSMFGVSQCVPWIPSAMPRLEARLRLDIVGAGASLDGFLFCEHYSGAACSPDDILGMEEQAFQLLDTGGVWVLFETELTAMQGVQSARCGLRIENDPTAIFFVNADRLYLSLETHIFSDGFESGDSDGWSAAAGRSGEPDTANVGPDQGQR